MERKWLAFLQFFMLSELTLMLTKAAPAVEDGWGEWSEWSPCTRACGPELSMQERSCRIQECDGPRKQFRSCPNKVCPEPLDLRVELCATYYNNSGHVYTPYADGENHCLLTCKETRADGGVTIAGQLEAAPGTPCNTAHGEEGMCVDALCTPVGCDNILGSDRRVDECGRCIGQGMHDELCVRKNSSVTKQEPENGHVEMVVLPSGASSITVTNLQPARQATLMVRSDSGEFLFTVGSPGSTFSAPGMEFTYEVKASGETYTERLTTSGKLTEDIVVEVYISRDDLAPSIMYEYYTLEEDIGPYGREAEGPLLSTPLMAGWVYGPFLPCSDTCITGTQTAYAVCRDLDLNVGLLDAYCTTTEKPLPILRQCGSGNCTPRWVSSEWRSCTETTCGTGSQHRLVECRRIEASGRDRVVPNDLCDATARPIDERDCVLSDSRGCGTAWQVEEWGKCCTSEPLDRRIECVNSSGRHRPPFLCSHLPRERSTKNCGRGPCTNGGCSWVPKRWFQCDNTCGQGKHTRKVICRNAQNKTAGDNCCRGQPQPLSLKDCYDHRAEWCQPEWVTGSWGKCSGICGEGRGVRRRVVECKAVNRHNRYITFPPEERFCPNDSRPPATEQCTRTDPECNDCEWEAGPWRECFCPVGIKLRTTWCSSGNDDCCIQKDSYPPPDGAWCNCPTPTTTVTTSASPTVAPPEEPFACTDYAGVNCEQLKQDGYCGQDNTDFFEELCCQTCSGSSTS